jgi:hypothetical protein
MEVDSLFDEFRVKSELTPAKKKGKQATASAASKKRVASGKGSTKKEQKKNDSVSDSEYSFGSDVVTTAAKKKAKAAISDDDKPMVPASKPDAKKVAKRKAKFADDGDADFMKSPKKAVPEPKAAKEGGAAVAKAAPKKVHAKAKAKFESPVAVRERPARARKPVTYMVGDSDDHIEEDDDSFHADDSDADSE